MPQDDIQRNTVNGTIYDAHNTPLKEVIVRAFDKDLRSKQLLGEAKTDVKGTL